MINTHIVDCCSNFELPSTITAIGVCKAIFINVTNLFKDLNAKKRNNRGQLLEL